MTSREPSEGGSGGVEAMLEMTSKFMEEAANAPAPSRPARRVLWAVLAVVGTLVVVGWIVLLFGD